MSLLEQGNPPDHPEAVVLDCWSRAFYLAGITKAEVPLTATEAKDILTACTPVTSITFNTLICLNAGSASMPAEHIAVVTDPAGPTLADRSGPEGEVRDNLSLIDLMWERGGLDTPLLFFQP